MIPGDLSMKNFYRKVAALALLIATTSSNLFSAAPTAGAPSASSRIPAPTPRLSIYDPLNALTDPAIAMATFESFGPIVRLLIKSVKPVSKFLTGKPELSDNSLLMAIVAGAGLSIGAGIALSLQSKRFYSQETNASLIKRANAFETIQGPLTPTEKIELEILQNELSKRYTNLYTPWNWGRDMKKAYRETYSKSISLGLPTKEQNMDSVWGGIKDVYSLN